MAGSGRDSRKGWFAGGIVYLTSLSYQVKQTVQTNYVLCPAYAYPIAQSIYVYACAYVYSCQDVMMPRWPTLTTIIRRLLIVHTGPMASSNIPPITGCLSVDPATIHIHVRK